MPRRSCALFFCLLVALPAAARSDAPHIQVDESAIRADLATRAVRVFLPVRSLADAAVDARIAIELLSASGEVIGAGERAVTLRPGAGSHAVVAASRQLEWDVHDLHVTRLRYHVEAGPARAAGIVALGPFVRDAFELVAVASDSPRAGAPYRVAVLAGNLGDGAPVAGVLVDAKVVFDRAGADLTLTRTAKTDSKGIATLDFDLPAGHAITGAEIEVTGRLGGFVDQASGDLHTEEPNAAIDVTTDKGLYQPGQMLHVRCLAFDEIDRRALAGASVEISIHDPEDDLQFTTTVTASRFGVAAVDWPILEGAALGAYTIMARLDGRDGNGSTSFAVSRYELPTFAVDVAPDRGYYLPGQSARVEVRADYLFGKPVPEGRVRVVRVFPTAEPVAGGVAEGEAGPDGRFVAHVDLAAEHAAFASAEHDLYRDVWLDAYVTDPRTNRTEQRRFAVRLTREDIHLYVVAPDSGAPGAPLDFYVTASLADGAPAECEVQVLAPTRDGWRRATTVRTNRYGVARVTGLALAADDDVTTLRFEARDGNGRTGTHAESFFTRRVALQVSTDRAIYRPAEPIRALVRSSVREGTALVELVEDARVVATQIVPMRGGTGEARFAYRPSFQGADLRVAARLVGPIATGEREASVRRVLYPAGAALTLALDGARGEYRPGDAVRARLRLRDRDGRGVEGALGVVVLDRAIVERERTNREFGFMRGLAGDVADDGPRVGGLTRHSLDGLVTSRPIPDDVALAAEVLLLAGVERRHVVLTSSDARSNLRDEFGAHFDEIARRLLGALLDFAERTGRVPRTEAESHTAVRVAGFDPATGLEDPWGTPLAISFPAGAIESVILVRSAGPDKRHGTADDVDVDRFFSADRLRSVSLLRESGLARLRFSAMPGPAGVHGALSGTLFDVQEAVIAGATVTLIDARGAEMSVVTGGDGQYHFRNIRPGVYSVRAEAAGFRRFEVVGIVVRASRLTELDVELDVGSMGETVDVVAGEQGIQVNTTNQTLATTVVERDRSTQPGGRPQRRPEIATPRVRQFFPETLYWQPSLETDREGNAEVGFALADSITTWRLAALASTEDGRITTVEADLRAFQPFFVEHDPPRVLTVGDEAALPVVLRNYLDRPHEVDVEVRSEPWLAAGPSRRVRLETNEAATVTFDLRATAATGDAPHRVTVTGASASDAVERPVSVHPDGEPCSVTASRLFTGSTSFDVAIPSEAMAISGARVKVYADPIGHVVESVEGLLQRPYGCAEQTLSSTYPNLLLLAHAGERLDPAILATARRYARDGTVRLLGYQNPAGGFGYWANGQPDVALTAYALRFLLDARALDLVDDAPIERARAALAAAQARMPAAGGGDAGRRVTAFVVRTLAAAATAGTTDATLDAAVSDLAAKARASDDPYMLASYALAAVDAGRAGDAAWALDRLTALARRGAGIVSWELDGETPFHGWGRTGSVEVTALVVEAFARAARAGVTVDGGPEVTAAGIRFLIESKDSHGVWHSTRTTVAVLDALMAMKREPVGERAPIDVFVDGARVASVELVARSGPAVVPLDASIGPGTHRVEVRGGGRAFLSAQFVASYYAPWPDASRPVDGRARGEANGLRLAVAYDRIQSAAGAPVTCTVEVSRATGAGMLIAEIGLPPGAEVDRESLERAIAATGSEVDAYELHPDRVVVYLSPGMTPTRFGFSFRPRYGISALAAPSTLYDYYNPDASVTLAPPRFVVGK